MTEAGTLDEEQGDLITSALSFGDVTVVAPKFHQSAMSAAVSLGMRQLAYKELPAERPGKWAYLDATPASCVKFGLAYLYENRDPDLVICGVNHGTNASTGANYSATLGATEEGALNGIKSIGVSICDFRPDADFSVVETLLPDLVRLLLDNWPDRFGLYYNINFPACPLDQVKGVKVARQGLGHWEREFEPWDEDRLHKLGLGDSFLWQKQTGPLEEGERAYFMRGDFVNDDPDLQTADHALNEAGWVTITPCQAILTDYEEYERLHEILHRSR